MENQRPSDDCNDSSDNRHGPRIFTYDPKQRASAETTRQLAVEPSCFTFESRLSFLDRPSLPIFQSLSVGELSGGGLRLAPLAKGAVKESRHVLVGFDLDGIGDEVGAKVDETSVRH